MAGLVEVTDHRLIYGDTASLRAAHIPGSITFSLKYVNASSLGADDQIVSVMGHLTSTRRYRPRNLTKRRTKIMEEKGFEPSTFGKSFFGLIGAGAPGHRTLLLLLLLLLNTDQNANVLTTRPLPLFVEV